jgi:glutaredoxin-like YruB-family protein
MKNAWLAGLVVFCVFASGFILVRGRAGGDATVLASFADEAQAAVERATSQLGGGDGREEAGDAADAPPATFYRYTDETGTVRFVSSLAEVPKALRVNAQPVGNRVQRAPALPPSQRAARQPPRRERAAPGVVEPSLDHEVVVYTTSWCGWCRKTLAFLEQEGVRFENRDIEADEAWREELIEKTGTTSIPVVEIDGELIRGYDPQRMARLLRSS